MMDETCIVREKGEIKIHALCRLRRKCACALIP